MSNYLSLLIFFLLFFGSLSAERQIIISKAYGGRIYIASDETSFLVEQKDENGELLSKNSIKIERNYISILDHYLSLFRERRYNQQGRLILEKFHTIDGKPLKSYPTIKYRYNQNHLLIQKSYHSIQNTPAVDVDGISSYLYHYDEQGHCLAEYRFGKNGQKAEKYTGIHSIHREFDWNGRKVAEFYLNRKGRAIGDIHGNSRYQYSYSPQGELTAKLVVKDDKQFHYRYTYHPNGLLIKESYQSAQESWTIFYQYDSNNNLINETKRDMGDRVLYRREWCFDKKNRFIGKKEFGFKGQVIEKPFILARKRLIFKWHSFLDYDDDIGYYPITFGVHQIRIRYPESGIKKIFFLDGAGNITKYGIGSIVKKRTGKTLSITYRRWDGTPIPYENTSRIEIQKTKNTISVSYYSTKNKQECKRRQIYYYYINRLLSRKRETYYNEKSIDYHRSFETRWQYNINGKLIKLSFYNLDGSRRQIKMGVHRIHTEYNQQLQKVMKQAYGLASKIIYQENFQYDSAGRLIAHRIKKNNRLVKEKHIKYFRFGKNIYRVQYNQFYELEKIKILPLPVS